MTAKQYEFGIKHKQSGAKNTVHATAATQARAHTAVVEYYGRDWVVDDQPIEVRAAHEIWGEIDCT